MFSKSSHTKKFVLVMLLLSLMLGGISGGVVGLYISQVVPPGSVRIPEESATIEVVKRVAPSVVSISVTKTIAQQPFGGFEFNPFFFEFGVPQEGNGAPEKQQVGGGSGFIVSSDGLIVTNRHVVEDTGAEYSVLLSDGRKFEAEVLARDPFLDLALIKIETGNLPTLTLGDSDQLQLGQTVIAIGNALGEFQNSVTKGVVSGVNRRIIASGSIGGSELIEEAIQTDAAINPGNSGGPLLNLDGTVIGVNTAVSQRGQSLGFAIPINVAKQTIESVQKFGRIIRPFLGVRYTIITQDFAKKNQLPVEYGALISRGNDPGALAIVLGSPADKAGLVENDIILEIDGVKIEADHPLAAAIAKKKVGDTVTLTLYHKGETKTVTVTLAELPKQ